MKVSDFTHAVNLRKLNETFQEFKREQITVTHSHFAQDQHYAYGQNGASLLLTFTDTIIQANSLYIRRLGGAQSPLVEILINSHITAGQGGRTEYWLLIYKRKGKQRSIAVDCSRFSSDNFTEDNDNYLRLFDLETQEKIRQNEYSFKPDDTMAELIRSGATETEQHKGFDALRANGLELVALVPFTHRIQVFLSYAKAKGKTLELGWWTKHTYNSVPNTLKIQWTKTPQWKRELVKITRLVDIKAETSGYYSHDFKYYVLDSQVPDVKRFVSKFKRNMKGTANG